MDPDDQPPAKLPDWDYVPDGWQARDTRATGWDHPSIGIVMARRWPEFQAVVNSAAPLGIYPLAPDARSESGHNVSMTFGYVLARAAHGRTRLSILDWGGAIGHYALMAERLMPEVTLDVTIKDLPDLCRIGQTLMPAVAFVETDEAAFARRYDLVQAMSCLQYVEDWRAILTRLIASADRFVFIARVPIARTAPSFVVLQRPYAVGYQTEYISWVINRQELIDHAASLGANLEREFVAGGRIEYPGAPEASETASFLFKV